MIFKQLFEPVSSTYTYLLGCEETGQAVLVDPVINAMDRDMQVLQELGLRLAYTLDTHIHADHITSALELKKRTGSRIAAPAIDQHAHDVRACDAGDPRERVAIAHVQAALVGHGVGLVLGLQGLQGGVGQCHRFLAGSK